MERRWSWWGAAGLVVLSSIAGCPKPAPVHAEAEPPAGARAEEPDPPAVEPEAEAAEDERSPTEDEADPAPREPLTLAALYVAADDLCDEAIDEGHRPEHACLAADRSRIFTPRIAFAIDKPDVVPASFPALDDLVALLDRYPSLELRIDVHKNAHPNDGRYSRRLTVVRAKALYQELLKRGIESSRLTAQGYEGDRPLVDPEQRGALEVNRRVEWIVVAPPP